MNNFRRNVDEASLKVVHALWIPAVFPLLAVLCSLILGVWSWGLMDDHAMITMPGGALERFPALFKGLLSWGVFRPTQALHVAVFYTLFEDHPRWFYIFRWFEVAAALAVWGWLAVLVTRRKSALPLLICITLCFYKFYDAFFFLSTQEYLGLILTGSAGVCFYKAFSQAVSRKGQVSWPWAGWGLFWLILGFGAKETFLVVGLVWGLAMACFGLAKPRIARVWIPGLLLTAASVTYGVLLKLLVTADYSSRYSFTNMEQIAANLVTWVRHDLLQHSPWIILTVVLLSLRRPSMSADPLRRWGVWIAIGFYVFYVLVLLPWDTGGHYSTPLGVLFAFLITVLIAERLEKIRVVVFAGIVAFALALNMLIGGSALLDAANYQQDTASLQKWLATNTQFEFEVVQNGAVVRANAEEPGGAIPGLVKLFYGKDYGPFIFTPRVREVVEDIRTRYYLYGPNWGDQDLSRLGKMWYPVFVSKNWIMFRRLF